MALVFTSFTRRVCLVGGAWALVRRLSRGVGLWFRRPHLVSSLVTSGSGVSELPQLSLPTSHPVESPTARVFYSGGSGLLRVNDSSRLSLSLSLSNFFQQGPPRPYLSKSHRPPEAIIQAKRRSFPFALTRLFR